MAQLMAVYGSTIQGNAQWFAGTIPVKVEKPYHNWPNLLNLTFAPPFPSYVEEPEYLWDIPEADPSRLVQQSFVRTFIAKDGSAYDAINIPSGLHRIVITHAADDFYSLNIYVNNKLIYPSPVQNEPSELPWRNVKSFLVEFTVKSGQTLQIQSIVTNDDLLYPGAYNPAMFTWVAQFYK